MGMGSFSVGFSVGFGTGLIAREAIPIMGEIVKPITRVSIKTSIRIFEKSRELVFRTGEVLEDLVAEVQTELKHDRKRKTKRQLSPKTTASPLHVAEKRKAA